MINLRKELILEKLALVAYPGTMGNRRSVGPFNPMQTDFPTATEKLKASLRDADEQRRGRIAAPDPNAFAADMKSKGYSQTGPNSWESNKALADKGEKMRKRSRMIARVRKQKKQGLRDPISGRRFGAQEVARQQSLPPELRGKPATKAPVQRAVAKAPPSSGGGVNVQMAKGKGYGYLAKQVNKELTQGGRGALKAVTPAQLRKRMGGQMLYAGKKYSFNALNLAGGKGAVTGGSSKKQVARATRAGAAWRGGGKAKYLAKAKPKKVAPPVVKRKPTPRRKVTPRDSREA